MDFQRDSIRPLANHEVYTVVKQIHEDNNDQDNHKRGKKGQNRSLEHRNIGLHTVTYETLRYLEQTPCVVQSSTIIKQFYDEIRKFGLKKQEILQILNLRPTTPVELQLIIEDSETRLSETQSEQLIELIRAHLPVVGGADQADETMES
jgi:DNA-directed RNA polymerase subunit F